MNTFIFIAAVMAAIAATAVAFPLLRSPRSRLAGALAGVLVMAAAAGLYPLWSNWNWRAAMAAKPAVDPQVLEMVAKLERHMKDAPDDIKGWLLLGRSDLALERADGADHAYEHAHRLDPNNVEALLGLGEALSLRAGGNITPPAGDLFERAVALEPDNPRALLYSGFGAATRGDRATARQRWLKLKGMHPPAEIDAMLNRPHRRARHVRSGAGRAAAGAPVAGAPGPAAVATGAAPRRRRRERLGGACDREHPHRAGAQVAPHRRRSAVRVRPRARRQGPPFAAKRLTSAATRLAGASLGGGFLGPRTFARRGTEGVHHRADFLQRPTPARCRRFIRRTYL